KTITVDIHGKEEEVLFGETIDLPNDVDDGDVGTTFDKWVDEDGNEVSDPYTVPDSDEPIVIKPVYKNLSFEVTFIDKLNGTSKTNTLEYTTKIPNPGTPSAEGYQFDGWFTEAGDKYVAGTTTVPNADVTYFAKYTGLAVDYTVNVYFEKLDGSGWEDVQAEVIEGVAGETAKYTETFDGFTLDTTISVTEAVIKGDGSTVLVIYFTRNDVTIIVDGEETKVPYGTEIEEDDLDADVEPGYKLDKWVDAEGNEITFPVEIKGGEEFIPVIVKDSFSLKFQLADGTIVGEETVAEFGADIVAPQAPDAAEGYTFAGWVDKATNEPFNGKMPAKATVYVAVYTNNEDANYKVNIYIMNTEGVEELSASYTATAAIGTTQSVVPGTVDFCTLDTARSNTSCVVLADGTASINLYFVRGLYTVSFDGVETEVYAGAVIPVPADPAVEGKTFTGWTPAVPRVMPEEDLAFTSTWEEVTYTITYVVNGNKTVHEYKFGDKVTALEVTESPAGLAFKGWSDAIPATMPAENITVSAIFEAAAYTVTYLDADGNVFVSYSVAFGAEIPVPADAPAKEFYTFMGWSAAPETMPAENVIITPIFEPVAVKLIAAPGSTTVIDRENMVIYGLEEGLSAKLLDDSFLDYEGDGTLVIKPVTEGTSRYGTGAVVELYDNADGSLVETFRIVVFGDLNGDSYVNGIDVSIASDEAFWLTDWSLEGENYEVYKLIAADLDHNGFIDTTDVSSIKNYVLSLVDIDQVEGKIVRS
ncbi:MAG: InlB B-repeat-containing protein, partial [Clostridia bacterium]|nr:InlB B-repeat-containing protein [Clostridia bacterium]